ncbi:MAG: VOC family protein [Planctomycetes bacterium]|nr:VOC family protein [Planctomycetota bacterium]
MVIKSCHHHGFTVSDINQSLEFYRDALGLNVERISERKNLPSYDTILGYANVQIKVAILSHPASHFILELFQYINPPIVRRELRNFYVGSSHVALQVDDIDSQYDNLRSHGFAAISPPVDVVRDGRRVARAMYALDPDGISVEMFEEYTDIVQE